MFNNLSSVTTGFGNFCLLRVLISLVTGFQYLSDLPLATALGNIPPKGHITRTVDSLRKLAWSGWESKASSLLLTEIMSDFYSLEIFTTSIWLGIELLGEVNCTVSFISSKGTDTEQLTNTPVLLNSNECMESTFILHLRSVSTIITVNYLKPNNI